MRFFVSLICIVLIQQNANVLSSSFVTISNNEYRNVLIAINPEVPEDPDLIEKIKSAFTEASQVLYTATKRRAYFKQINILIPKTWFNVNAEKANKETYDAADIIIANPNPKYEDQPYALQYGGCGDPGTYIHLTPSYIQNSSFDQDFGPKGKVIVHEWAHYRWGVFDETYTYGYSPFYHNSDGKIEATRCSTSIRGEISIIDYEAKSAQDCDRFSKNGLPEDVCEFLPYEEQPADLSTSMMSYQYLDKVTTFCHNDDRDPLNMHNRDAPNEQNRLCQLQSTWEVILQSIDFASNANPPGVNDQSTTPTFRIIRSESSRRFVLVLDTSTSMYGKRIDQMRQVVNIYISQFALPGDRIGMVEFNTRSHVLAKLTAVHSQNDRASLLKRIPNEAGGYTCIGCGIQQAIAVLEDNGGSVSGGHIIVFTDGEENRHPYVADIAQEVVDKGGIVDAIFFATDAQTNLKDLVKITTGTWFYGGDKNIVNILGAFKSLSQPSDGDVFEDTFEVHSETFQIENYSTQTGKVVIDKTIGNNTVFSFTWSQYKTPISVVIESPSGCTYSTNAATSNKAANQCNARTSPDINDEFKIVTFKIPSTAETGTWIYHVSLITNRRQIVTATVTSQAVDLSIPPVKVIPALGRTTVGTGQGHIIYAQVSQGLVPVLGANVIAHVELPNGTNIPVKLFDDGSAPDLRSGDGVYSRYFIKYRENGTYAVQISVTNGKTTGQSNIGKPSFSRATLNYGTLNKDGTAKVNPSAANYNRRIQSANVGNFSRIVTSPGFEYTGVRVSDSTDLFKPSKVTNLVATQVDVNNSSSGIILTFTAPGDDLDHGTVSRYEIRYVINNISWLIDDFENCSITNESMVVEGNLEHPLEAGSKQRFVIKLEELKGYSNQFKVGFAMKSYDDSSNAADISNVAVITYFLSPPIIPYVPPPPTDEASHLFVIVPLIVISIMTSVLFSFVE